MVNGRGFDRGQRALARHPRFANRGEQLRIAHAGLALAAAAEGGGKRRVGAEFADELVEVP